MKKITKVTIKRTIRTFVQAFVGSFVSSGILVGWTDTDIKNSFMGCLLTALFAGLGATYMNLEKKDSNDDYEDEELEEDVEY